MADEIEDTFDKLKAGAKAVAISSSLNYLSLSKGIPFHDSAFTTED